MIPHDPSEHVEHMPGVGDLIGGRYRLESVIGHGALGTVMRAQHITMGREVAVKLLRPSLSNDSTIRRRLIQRVHQAQRLSHPNNCRLFDFGQSAGSLFLVMELLQGATLKTVIERGAPYPVGWVLDLGMQLLDGLGEAHDNDFIHRNLKPRNIFLLPRRRGGQQVKILDYGLASSLDTAPDSADDGGDGGAEEREAEICGSAAYLAPETLVKQTSGKPTDVYAVGLILIEMLTGEQVFSGNSLAQVLYRQIHTSVRLPPKLEWTTLGKVLMKSVSKHPGNRFADADAFYEALEQASETTASYFRLDVGDLEPDDEPMSPEMLARLLKKQRRRGSSDRDDNDDDADDADPEPLSTTHNAHSGKPSRSDRPMMPPPVPSGGEVRSCAPGGRVFGSPIVPPNLDGDAFTPPPTHLNHPLREATDEVASQHISFPRGGREVDDFSVDADRDAAPPGVQDSSSSRGPGGWARLEAFGGGEGGWASRASLLLVALVLSGAGLGLYLILA